MVLGHPIVVKTLRGKCRTSRKRRGGLDFRKKQNVSMGPSIFIQKSYGIRFNSNQL